MLFRKDIKEIVYDDIKSVLQSNLDELATVDYKEILPKTKEKNADNKKDFKQEFLKDVCAFVNSYGGWIIYGITDSKQGGKRNASNVVGVSFKDWEEAKQTLRDWIIASTEPKVLFDFHHVAIPDKKDKCVVILRIYPSHSKPHAVIVDKGEPKFYRRFGDATSVMSFRDIREMFFMSSAWSKRIEEFYHDRITRIQNGSTPVPLPNRPKPMPVIQNIETRPFLLNQAIAAIHVIPHSWGEHGSLSVDELKLAYNDPTRKLDPPSWAMKAINMGIMGQSRRYNLDGVACFDSQQGSYTQLFRRGAIEGVWPISKPESKYIWGPSVEQVTCSVLRNYLSFLSDLRLMPPASIFMTLLNMDSHEIVFADEHISNPGPRMEWEPPFPSREAVLPLPETTITDFSAEVRPIVKPMLEVLYQISGWLNSTI